MTAKSFDKTINIALKDMLAKRQFPRTGSLCKQCIVAAFLIECCAENPQQSRIPNGLEYGGSILLSGWDLYDSFVEWFSLHRALPRQPPMSRKKFGLILKNDFRHRSRRGTSGSRATAYYAVELSGMRPEVLQHTVDHKDITAVFEAARQEEAS